MVHKKAAKKSVEQRRARRNRYVAAIDPLRKRYNCSAAEVLKFVVQTESNLESQISNLEKNLVSADETQIECEKYTDYLEATLLNLYNAQFPHEPMETFTSDMIEKLLLVAKVKS